MRKSRFTHNVRPIEAMHLPALLDFLAGLEQNNNRPWFVHNKPAYDILRETRPADESEEGEAARQ